MTYIEEIKKSFDEKFGTFTVGSGIGKKMATEDELKSFLTSSLQELGEKILSEIKEKEKSHPPSLKQEIWGGEQGFPSTKIESPDVFGIKFVDGYNSALSDITQVIKELTK